MNAYFFRDYLTKNSKKIPIILSQYIIYRHIMYYKKENGGMIMSNRNCNFDDFNGEGFEEAFNDDFGFEEFGNESNRRNNRRRNRNIDVDVDVDVDIEKSRSRRCNENIDVDVDVDVKIGRRRRNSGGSGSGNGNGNGGGNGGENGGGSNRCRPRCCRICRG